MLLFIIHIPPCVLDLTGSSHWMKLLQLVASNQHFSRDSRGDLDPNTKTCYLCSFITYRLRVVLDFSCFFCEAQTPRFCRATKGQSCTISSVLAAAASINRLFLVVFFTHDLWSLRFRSAWGATVTWNLIIVRISSAMEA